MDVLTKEERNDIKLFKCRSVGESFNYDDWRGRDALVRGLATAEAQLAARDAEIARLTQELGEARRKEAMLCGKLTETLDCPDDVTVEQMVDVLRSGYEERGWRLSHLHDRINRALVFIDNQQSFSCDILQGILKGDR